jgi:hypothetical protein
MIQWIISSGAPSARASFSSLAALGQEKLSQRRELERAAGKPRAAFWGPLAFVALLVIAFAAL